MMTHARRWCHTIVDLHASQLTECPIPSPVALLLERGVEWTERRPWRWRGTQGACYRNAQYLARTRKGLRYAEGFATGVIPLEHAWCVDAEGRVVDPTWNWEYEPDYFGMTFDQDLVRRIRQLTGRSASLLFSWWKWREVYRVLENGGGKIP